MHCTVGELLGRMSSQELTEWVAFFTIRESEQERAAARSKQRTQLEARDSKLRAMGLAWKKPKEPPA